MNWKQAAFEKGLIRLDLAGSFVPAISDSVMRVWELWTESLPIRKNEWSLLTENLQKGWLDAIRYQANRHTEGI